MKNLLRGNFVGRELLNLQMSATFIEAGDHDKKSAARKAGFFMLEILTFRLDCETNSGLGFAGDFGLIL